MRESGAGLIRKHGFDPAAHETYINTILGRFRNPHLHDDVTRVGREPLRKLSATDRLVKPMMTALGYGLPVDKLIVGIGAALHYNNPDDKQSVELQQKIADLGVVAAFREVSGVEDEAILAQVEKAYNEVTA